MGNRVALQERESLLEAVNSLVSSVQRKRGSLGIGKVGRYLADFHHRLLTAEKESGFVVTSAHYFGTHALDAVNEFHSKG